MIKKSWVIALGVAFMSVVSNTGHAEHGQSFPKYSWGFNGIFGGYDLSSVQRGYLVYRKSCASCHSIHNMRYADLQQTGLTLEQIDKVIKTDRMLDGKDAQGQDVYRPVTVKDNFAAPYVNDSAAKFANMGKIPFDFSRYGMTVDGKADYMMAILLGYRNPPEGFRFARSGMSYNLYAKDHQIVMKSPLVQDGVKYTDGTPASVEQQAKDVVTFLSWTAHPHLIERHRIGISVFLYVLFIAVLTVLVKRKVWLNVK